MKKFGAMFMALVLACSLAGCAASSKLPVNGFEAQKRNEESWFIVQGEDFIEELNAKGEEAGYPKLDLVYNSEYGSLQNYDYGIGSGEFGQIELTVTSTKDDRKYDDPVGGHVIRIDVDTDIRDEEKTRAIGFYLDQIVGMFSPRDKDEIEEKLMMFSAVEGMGEYISGNVLYKRTSTRVTIDVNEEEAELLILDEDKTPPPHLIKPE